MSDLDQSIKDGLLTIIQRQHPAVVEVLDWYDTYAGPGCDTCGYGAGVEIHATCRREDGSTYFWEYDGGFGRLMQELGAP